MTSQNIDLFSWDTLYTRGYDCPLTSTPKLTYFGGSDFDLHQNLSGNFSFVSHLSNLTLTLHDDTL